MAKEKPLSATPIRFTTRDGKKHFGFFLKDGNKFVEGTNKWKDVDEGKWYDNGSVEDWETLPEWG